MYFPVFLHTDVNIIDSKWFFSVQPLFIFIFWMSECYDMGEGDMRDMVSGYVCFKVK